MQRYSRNMDTNTYKKDQKILTWTYRKDTDESTEAKAIDIDTIIAGDDDVSFWNDRHTVRYKS